MNLKACALLLSLIPCAALAQGGPVTQSGQVTPGHVPAFVTSNVIGDGGSAVDGSITNLGLVGNGTPFCINDVGVSAASGYHQLCIGANALGGGLLSYNAFGGAAVLPFQFNINGTTYVFPGQGQGNVTGPASTTLGYIPTWAGTTGTLLSNGTGTGTIGGLIVTGGATVGSTLGVTGLLTTNGGLVATGGVTLAGGVGLAGGLDITSGGLAVTGGASTDTLAASGNATVGGTLGVTGAATFSAAGTALAVTHNATIGGTLGVTGVATFSSAPSIIGGTINLQGGSKVTSTADTVNLASSNGPILALSDNSQTVTNGIMIQTSGTSTAPVKVTAAGTGGIDIASQFENNRGSLGAISTSTESLGLFASYYNGQDGTTGTPSGLFAIYPIYQSGYVSAAGANTLLLRTVVGAGVVSRSFGGVYGNVNQTGAAGPLPPWTTDTSYAQGAVVQNGYNMYGAVNAGTSGATPPTCGSGTCSDGTITWQYQSYVGTYMQLVGGSFFAANAYNDGGTASVPMGGVFGNVFGAIANPGATYLTQVIGGEDDCSLATGASSSRFACFQFVRTGGQNGSNTDIGLSIDAGGGISGQVGFHDAVLFQNATSPNGVGLRFQNQFGGAAGFQVMAGAFDCIWCQTTGLNNYTDGHLGAGGGGYIVRGPNAQLLGSGDLQLGYTLFHITSTGLSIDTSDESLASVSGLSGGTNWPTSGIPAFPAYDPYGNQLYVAASGGVPTSVAIEATTFIPSASIPGGAVTICAEAPSLYTSPVVVPTCFTATETYTAQTTLGIGTAAATAINIGNSGSNTVIAGTLQASNLPTTCTGHSGYVAAVANVLTLCP